MASSSLRCFGVTRIVGSLKYWSSSSDHLRTELGEAIIRRFESLTEGKPTSLRNKHFHEQVELFSRIFSGNKCDIDEFLSSDLDSKMEQLLTKFSRHQMRCQENFLSIKKHHTDLKDTGWNSQNLSSTALAEYGIAATETGTKDWVVKSNTWILTTLQSFFLKKGLYREFFKELTQKSQSTDCQTNIPFSNLANPTSHHFRILDVGSCYNPLPLLAQEMNLTNFHITALDLHPMSKSVYKCDFLGLRIIPQAVVPPPLPQDSGNHEITELPPNSYHILSLTLVLSYLPTSELRYQMLLKAKEILRKPSGFPSVEDSLLDRYGLLCIVDTYTAVKKRDWIRDHGSNLNSNIRVEGSVDSKFQKETISWLPEMESIGFKFLKYQTIHNETVVPYPLNNKVRHRKCAVGFLFRTMSPLELQERLDASGKRKFHTLRQNVIQHPIAIIGAGIGGAALGYIFNMERIPYLLFDRDLSIMSRPQGYALTIQQGISVLRSIGITTSVTQNRYNKNITHRMDAPIVVPNCTISHSHVSLTKTGELLGVFGPPIATQLPPYSSSYDFAHFEYPRETTDPEGRIDDISKNARQNIHMPRKALRDTLLIHSNSENIRWNHKLEDISSVGPSCLSIRFRGQSNSYLVSGIVGCDGIYSTVRQILFNKYFFSETQSIANNLSKSFHEKNLGENLNFLDLFVILGIAPSIDLNQDQSRVRRKVQWLDGRTRVFSMPYDEGHDMWQLSFPISTEEILKLQQLNVSPENGSHHSHFSSQDLKKLALSQCSNWHPTLLDMLSRTDVSLISGHPVYDRHPIDLYQLRKQSSCNDLPITLLGDAWHPMSPFKAQGANQALIDADTLAKRIILSLEKKEISQSLGNVFSCYEFDAFSRSAKKVIKSRLAAQYLHSSAALTPGNITRASAAESGSRKQSTDLPDSKSNHYISQNLLGEFIN